MWLSKVYVHHAFLINDDKLMMINFNNDDNSEFMNIILLVHPFERRISYETTEKPFKF